MSMWNGRSDKNRLIEDKRTRPIKDEDDVVDTRDETIKGLQARVALLEAQILEHIKFQQELIFKLIDKGVAPPAPKPTGLAALSTTAPTPTPAKPTSTMSTKELVAAANKAANLP